MALYQLKSSFAGGELSAAMFGRVDMNKYDSGAAELKNFLVLRYGGAANRPGFKFIAQTYNNKKAVLIPFVYSTDQIYNIEITAGRCQFYTGGSILKNDDGTPYSIENFFTDRDMENPEKIKYTQSADVLFLVHPDHAPMTLTRYGALDWRFEMMDITGGPFDEYTYNSGTSIEKTMQWMVAGTYSFIIPQNVKSLDVEMSGGGAGGCGGAGSEYYDSTYLARGGNGGSGELVKATVAVTAGDVMTLSVGAGGSGGRSEFHRSTTNNTGKPGAAGGKTVAFGLSAGGGRLGTPGQVYYKNNGTNYGSIPGINGAEYSSKGASGGAGANGAKDTVGVTGSDGWLKIRYVISIGDNVTVQSSDIIGNVTLTASKNIFNANDVNTLFAVTHYVKSDYKKGTPTTAGDNLKVDVLPKGTVYVESFGFWDGVFTLEKYDEHSSAWVTVKSQLGNRSQNYNFTETNSEDAIVSYRVTSTEFNTGVWSGENDKQRGYVTIQSFGNDYTGHVLITEFVNETQVKGIVKQRLGSTLPTKTFAFAAWNKLRGYPACAGFYEDRLVFAGSKSSAQTFWTSKTGDYYNCGVSNPGADDDAITATLNGGQMNGIKAIIAFGEMILLTAGGEYKVSGGGKPITGSNILSQPQEYRGVSDVNPVTVGSRIVYVQQQGNIIRDLAYSYDVDKYTGDDLNLLASHLFDGHKIISMTYQQIPNSIIWCVRDDGLLLGLTYIKEQDVYAWHQHQTVDGRFVSVCSIGGRTEDQLYAVIERGGRYNVEMLASRDMGEGVADQFYVDSGVSYSGEPVTEISGLEHLEGYKVTILADGNVLPEQMVTDGKVVLGNAYNKVQVGLPIDAVLRSLPIEFQGQDGTYLSRKKRIATINIMLKDSRGGLYGINEKKLDEIKWRSTENYGEPIKLQTGKFKITVPSATWSETQQVIIKQHLPLPLTVLAMVPEIEAGG